MMKYRIAWLITVVLVLGAASTGAQVRDGRLYDLAAEKDTTLSRVLPELAGRRIILVGERHSVKAHHDIQLEIIRSLEAAGVPVAVGLEMFRADSQAALDQWTGGQTSRTEFQRLYYDNWNFPWYLYGDIFEYTREKQIPLVGLNVPRDITRQVAREGFDSLTAAQRGRLPEVACRVDRKYMQFVRKAFGAHAHGHLNFTYFCEAQLIWDTAMAINALKYLDAHPQRTLVLITGSGHARKMGIPEQIRQRSSLVPAVVLPEIPGSTDPETIGVDDADFIFRIP